jgi:hypothetical protein
MSIPKSILLDGHQEPYDCCHGWACLIFDAVHELVDVNYELCLQVLEQAESRSACCEKRVWVTPDEDGSGPLEVGDCPDREVGGLVARNSIGNVEVCQPYEGMRATVSTEESGAFAITRLSFEFIVDVLLRIAGVRVPFVCPPSVAAYPTKLVRA